MKEGYDIQSSKTLAARSMYISGYLNENYT